ncbi:MAG: geranylgeranylglyceryl/heptaprenylglyceryl phosphate synthase [Candidatus Poribacteria bacterium]|nr:geranylgeranylglyceryl/heptaprenylglyceryl phosphate synthase [Candidatus Poribacteria bacterium]
MKSGSTLDYLLNVLSRCRAGYIVLLDPDRHSIADCMHVAHQAEEAGVDALLLGSSLLTNDLNPFAKALKDETSLPVIVFPGDSMHLSQHADAILYLSLISGRNANFLIGEQVKAAPLIHRCGIEAISTGYMLIDGGTATSVEVMSGTAPLPRDKLDIAWAHALAAEYLGMKFIYLEAGSGAKIPVPEELIGAVRKHVTIPIIVGGGITTPELAVAKVNAGADFIVTGNVIEQQNSFSLMNRFADAVHG